MSIRPVTDSRALPSAGGRAMTRGGKDGDALGGGGAGDAAGRRPLCDRVAADRGGLADLRGPAVPALPSAFALWRAFAGQLEGLHRPAPGLRAALDLAGGPALPARLPAALPEAPALAALADRALGPGRADDGQHLADPVRS